jgi:hypothetical protein
MAELEAATRAAHIAELAFAQSAVEDNGYTADAIDDGPDSIPELVITLDADEDGRERTMHLSFMPTDDDLDHSKILQIWSALPFTAGEDCPLADLQRAVAIVNEHVGVGRFGVQEDGTLYFRFDLAAPKHTLLDDDMLAEIVALADFHQEHFSDYLEGVCDGEISVLVLDAVITQAE